MFLLKNHYKSLNSKEVSQFETLLKTLQTVKRRSKVIFLQAGQKRKKIMKFFLVSLFLNFSLFGYPFAKSHSLPSSEISIAESPAESVLQTESVQDSVWRIHNIISTGTAFAIEPNLFVTNFHVLYFMLEKVTLESIVLDQKASSSRLKIKRIVAVSTLYDLAFFETEQNVTSYLSIAENPPQPNKELFILGYPEGELKEMKNTGKLTGNGHYYTVSINHSHLRGASGSPVLDKERQVVGVLFRSSVNHLVVIKSKHLKGLIAGKIGLNCSDFINLAMCLKKEIENLKQNAEQGDAPAQYELARVYYDGKGTEKDLKLAFSWYKKSADQGYVPAQYGLALMYYNGEGTKKDMEFAFSWYKESAEQGDTLAQNGLAGMYYRGEGTEKDLKLAFDWVKKSADQGYAPAQYALAGIYYNGEGIEKDLKSVFDWMKKSADQGYAPAQNGLAGMYYRGEGTEKDLELAFDWMKKSADQGYASAQNGLAEMYYFGEGTEKDLELAFDWMKKSADQGYVPSQNGLALMYYETVE